MSASPLSNDELACLRKLAREDGVRDAMICGSFTLSRLERLGYIERFVALWLPLEMRREGYRLTPAGNAALRNA